MKKSKILKSLLRSLYDYATDLDDFCQTLEIYGYDKIVDPMIHEAERIWKR